MNALEAVEHPLAAHWIPRLHVTIEWMGQSYLSIKHYPHLDLVRTSFPISAQPSVYTSLCQLIAIVM